MISHRNGETGTYGDISISLHGLDKKATCRFVVFVSHEQKTKTVCTWKIAEDEIKNIVPIKLVDWRLTSLSSAPSAACMKRLINKRHIPTGNRVIISDTRTVYIYVLDCPLTGATRYVGQTLCPKNRLGAHIRHPCTANFSAWINALSSYGLVPTMRIIDTVVGKPEANRRESELIDYFDELGTELLNVINPPAYR